MPIYVLPKDRKRKRDKKFVDLSDEDLSLKQQLELYVKRVQDPDPDLQKAALENIRQEIQIATSSITSVPKPLKFLLPHYGNLKDYYEILIDLDLKKLLADILSVLALTMSAEGERDSLKYRLLGSKGGINSWGHEYVRNIAGELVLEYKERQSEDGEIEDLLDLIDEIVDFYIKLKKPVIRTLSTDSITTDHVGGKQLISASSHFSFALQHNAEPEAVDFLIEVEDLGRITVYLKETNFKRTCLYLTSLGRYLPEPEDNIVLETTCQTYNDFKAYPYALRIALLGLKLPDVYMILKSCHDMLCKKQLCYILARHGVFCMLDEDTCADDDARFDLQDIINNMYFNDSYLYFAGDIEVMEPKSPEDIYKMHIVSVPPPDGIRVDYAWQNLAATFVNAFLNAGFGQDNLIIVPSEYSSSDSVVKWLFNYKDHATSAAASLGLIMLWNVDAGLAQMDKYLKCNINYVMAGALLGIGILNCGVKHDLDPAFELLYDYVNNEDSSIQIGAIMGLGITYAGCRNKQLYHKFNGLLRCSNTPLDVIAFTSISLGLVYVSSCYEKAAEAIKIAFTNRSESELGEPLSRFLALGLGLLYLGRQEEADATEKVSATFYNKIGRYCDITLLSCAYAGTGNVLKVQELLRHCGQHIKSDGIHQAAAVLGVSMVAMGEELGLDMAIRSLELLLRYGEPNIRMAVPLALGLLCISNPKVNVIETLSRLMHDSDQLVIMAAVISLGLIGAGTNNARIAGMLHKFSSPPNYIDPRVLFCIRIAQGLVHLGKGLLTLNPCHSDRFLLSPVGLAGLAIFLHAMLDVKSILLGKYHFVIYFLVLAMQPKMLMTVDKDLKPLAVPVRVGKAVDVIGQAGQPKTITGFQTYNTPVILNAGETAELATDKYIPLSPILEGFAILTENPEYREDN